MVFLCKRGMLDARCLGVASLPWRVARVAAPDQGRRPGRLSKRANPSPLSQFSPPETGSPQQEGGLFREFEFIPWGIRINLFSGRLSKRAETRDLTEGGSA